jgi:hypothetical protein
MKNLKLMMMTLMMSFMIFNYSNSQTFKKIFLGEDFMHYKGSIFKIDSNETDFSYMFYDDLKYCQKPYDNNVVYSDSKYKYKTVKDSIINMIFLVEDIIDKNGNPYKNSHFGKAILLLHDTITNKKIYYPYNASAYNFPFLVSNFKFDLTLLCLQINKNIDDFTKEITFNTPRIENVRIAPMIIYKTIKNGKVYYDLSLTTYGSTVNIGKTGIIILLDDGTKINKPTIKIDVNAKSDGFEYRAYVRLTEAEVKLLATKQINKFRLYIYDKEVDSFFAEKFLHYVNCIIGK